MTKTKMRKNPSYLWRVRNPSIWNRWQEGHDSIGVLAESYNLSVKTVENILRAFENCPENPRRYNWEQSQGWRWNPSLASIRKENLQKYRPELKAPKISEEQVPTSTYMTFTYEGKEHTIEAITFGAIIDLWNQDRSITSLITKVEVR